MGLLKKPIAFSDLSEDLQEEILNSYKLEVESELKTEAHNSPTWKTDIIALYDMADELDLDEFVEEKAEEKIKENFKGVIQY